MFAWYQAFRIYNFQYAPVHFPAFQHTCHHLFFLLLNYNSYIRKSPAFAGLFRQAAPHSKKLRMWRSAFLMSLSRSASWFRLARLTAANTPLNGSRITLNGGWNSA